MEPRTQAVAILLFIPGGIPLVRNKSKPDPHYWKLPGGKGIPKHDNTKRIALGKLKKEIGVCLAEKDLTLVHSENRGNHDFSLFIARPRLKKNQNSESVDETEKKLNFFHPKQFSL